MAGVAAGGLAGGASLPPAPALSPPRPRFAGWSLLFFKGPQPPPPPPPLRTQEPGRLATPEPPAPATPHRPVVTPEDPPERIPDYTLADRLILRHRTKAERPPESADPFISDHTKGESGFKSRAQWRKFFADKSCGIWRT